MSVCTYDMHIHAFAGLHILHGIRHVACLAKDVQMCLLTHNLFLFSIKYLLLNNIYGLTNRSVCVIARLCPGLVQLSVQGCWRLTDQAIQ